MKLINQERAKQLEGRILIMSQKHKKFHHNCFKGGEQLYYKIQKERSDYIKAEKEKGREYDDIYEDKNCPVSWEDSKERDYLHRSGRILDKLRNELLAIIYYNAVRNSGYTFKMIEEVKDINKYNQAGFGYNAIDLSPLFPKTKEEKELAEKLANATALEKLDIVKTNYHAGGKEENEFCNNLVKSVGAMIVSDKKVTKGLIESTINESLKAVCDKYTIIQDKETTSIIEDKVNSILSESEYSFKIELC
jgi:hypothetical protein